MSVGARLDMVGVGHVEVMLMVVLLNGWPYTAVTALFWCSTRVDAWRLWVYHVGRSRRCRGSFVRQFSFFLQRFVLSQSRRI